MALALKKRVKALEISNKKRRDFDPEDDPFSKNVDDSDESHAESELDGETTGREHYEDVGMSRLRQPEKVELDEKKYGGQAVSRAALHDEDDNDSDPFGPTGDDEDEDPFAIRPKQASDSDEANDGVEDGDSDGELPDFGAANEDIDEDDEIDSDEAFGDGEEEAFKRQGFVFRGSGKNKKQVDLGGKRSRVNGAAEEASEDDLEDVDGSSDSLGDESDVEMNEVEGDGDDDDDDEVGESSEDEEEASARPGLRPLNSEREKLKSVLFADTAAVATSLTQAASADAEKGIAVRQQYQTFDRLLDARIKLQKAFTIGNDLNTHKIASQDTEAQSALKKAEEAAIRLYTTIESLRHSIIDANTSTQPSGGKKRKRPSPATTAITSVDLSTRMRELEGQLLPHRRSVLDRWSNKTRAVTPMSSQSISKLNPERQQTKLSSILDTYLLTESDKLISQSTTSDDPSNLTTPTPDTDSGVTNTNNNHSYTTYNDTIYYQSLLRDLIASRARSNPNSSSSTNLSSTSDPLPLKLHTSGNTKRKDTKASKGRKVRYTVHEKLENFMAATGRDTGSTGQWTDAAVREFFGSLMGNKGQLDEGDDDDDHDEDGGINGNGEEDDREVEALRLFRS